MPETTVPVPRVVSIEIPETNRRTPFAVVHVAVGPLTVALGVVLPRSGWFMVRPPLSILGKPAVTGPTGLWEKVERLAIAAVRHARVRRRRYNRTVNASAACSASTQNRHPIIGCWK